MSKRTAVSAPYVRQVLAEVVGLPLVGSYSVLSAECFQFGVFASAEEAEKAYYVAPIILELECFWEIRSSGKVLASSVDLVCGPDDDSHRPRLRRLEKVFQLDLAVKEVVLRSTKRIGILFTNGIVLSVQIKDRSKESWRIYRSRKSSLHCYDSRFIESIVDPEKIERAKSGSWWKTEEN